MERLGPAEEPWARATYAMFVEADDERLRIETVLKVADSDEPGRRR